MRFKYLILFLLLFATIANIKASHLRAADIIAERTGPLTYRVTVTVYTDFESVQDSLGSISATSAAVSISDGFSANVPRTSVQFIGNGTFENKYIFNHTFPAAGTGYFIRYEGVNRNAGILNIGSPSDNQALFVETFTFIDAFDPNLNRTPELVVPPIDLASVGQVYTHNPGAFDPDGDSISFRLITPQQGNGILVNQYSSPDDPSFGAGANFSLDNVTGDIVWDAPATPGEYNIAFMVEEWRAGIRIGYVIRDMQIIVLSSDNIKPELVIPEDTCMIAGVPFVDTIIAYDPDGHDITVSTFGSAFTDGTATLTQNLIFFDSIVGVFSWTPECEFIRQQPHQLIFKVEDDPLGKPSLATLATWNVLVHAPAPSGLVATSGQSDIRVSWDRYLCESEAEKICIWRTECDTSQVIRSECEVGVPDDWGFVKIGEVAGNDTTFLDDDNGVGLSAGVQYYYILTVDIGAPNFGESYASEIIGGGAGINNIVMTNVDVTATDSINGTIEVRWRRPIGLDQTTFPGPYTVSLYRDTGTVTSFTPTTPIYTLMMATLEDSAFVDSGLNTLDTSYTYVVELLSGTDTVGYSGYASSTRLTTTAGFEEITLDWSNEVPWSFPDTLYQYVYMDSTGGGFNLIDSVVGGQTSITITGLENCKEHCFYIETSGIYCNDSLNEVLTNKSQVRCAFPADTVPPCAPALTIAAINCELFNDMSPVENYLSWQDNICENEPIVAYNIYTRRDPNEDFVLLETSTDTANKEFLHDSLESMAVCYVVSAIDKSGNESEFSNEVCGDNCEYFELPNVFTPNGSGPNELFVPIPTPRFVENIDIEVYSRWGKLVYRSSSTTNIDWDGKDLQGQDVTEGVYYYKASVTFDKLQNEDRIREFKGWVLIAR